MIRAVFFDFGGVLVRTSDRTGQQALADRLGISLEALNLKVMEPDVWNMAFRGDITHDELWQTIGLRLGLTAEDGLRLRVDYWRGDRRDEDLVLLIDELRARGCKVGLLSNASSALNESLQNTFYLADKFDQIIISADIGLVKPDAEIYRYAARSLGLSTPECAFIDDLTLNVEGAQAVGMQAIHYVDGLDVRAALLPLLEVDATRALIFDFGNVLDIPQDWATWRQHRDEMAAPLGMTGEQLGALVFQSDAWHQVKVGAIPFEQYLDTIFRPVGLTEADAQRAFFDRYFTHRAIIHPAMRDMLSHLKGRYRLGLLSNAYQLDMRGWLQEFHGLGDYFDDVISSADVRLAKPDPAIYALACQRLGVRPGETIFVDDLVRNTSIAESLGLPSIVFESPEQLRAALIARGLLEGAE